MAKHGGNQGGRERHADLLALGVGDSILLPWRAVGRNDHLRCRVNYAAKVSGRAFRREPTGQGLRVTRLPDPVKII